VRIALADDSLLFREGLARLLVEGGFEVAGQASDAESLLALVDSTAPDVAIVDIRMPPDHRDEGLAAAHAIKEQHPGVGVLVLSQYVEPHYALALVDDRPRGAGYLLKDRVEDLNTLREHPQDRRRRGRDRPERRRDARQPGPHTRSTRRAHRARA
jgi:DNA-binding NarL/FixJ family response regulator